MKQITIAGRIGKDAEIRQTQGGTAVCKFSVATDQKRGSEKVTTWFDVSIFGKRGEALCQYLRKGSSVVVAGDLDARMYQANDGSTRLALGVVASEVTLLGGGQRDENRDAETKSGGSYDRPPSRGGRLPETDPFGDDFGGDEDIPF